MAVPPREYPSVCPTICLLTMNAISGFTNGSMYGPGQGSPNNGGCALPCNIHALGLQFEAVRPSWLKPDVHTSPAGLQLNSIARLILSLYEESLLTE